MMHILGFCLLVDFPKVRGAFSGGVRGFSDTNAASPKRPEIYVVHKTKEFVVFVGGGGHNSNPNPIKYSVWLLYWEKERPCRF